MEKTQQVFPLGKTESEKLEWEEFNSAHLKIVFNYLKPITEITVLFMAFSLLLCHPRLGCDIMDAQACSHSSKLIYHWLKVKEQSSAQTMGSEKGTWK